MNYYTQWGHLYVIHFGAWVSFCMATNVYKKGLPKLVDLWGLFKVAIILSLFLSAFSSHSHNHYLSKISKTVGVVK